MRTSNLGKGVDGFGRYYWRGFVDKTDGNYLVIFALPTVLHEDERYYAKGEGGICEDAAIYAASRILITPDYHGHNTFNASEVFGRAMAQGISIAYYPSPTGLREHSPSSTDGRWDGTRSPIFFASSGRILPPTCSIAIHNSRWSKALSRPKASQS